LVLGLVQGLTEFIPVSSSGHLVLGQRLFGWHHNLNMSFNVAVHLGTLLALLVYFRREWIALIKGFFTSLATGPRGWAFDQRLAWMLVLASIPAALAGALFGDAIEAHLQTPAWVAMFIVVGAVAMLAAELWGARSRDFEGLRVYDAGIVGTAQVLALAPGISRSGITISGGMLAGLDREAAARFAFLISAPIIAGAGLWEGQKLVRQGMGGHVGIFLVGFAASAVTGFIAIKFMLAFLKKHTLTPFIIYRFVLAAVVLIVLAVK
jgi:undecaprenyl-diphosphatase